MIPKYTVDLYDWVKIEGVEKGKVVKFYFNTIRLDDEFTIEELEKILLCAKDYMNADK